MPDVVIVGGGIAGVTCAVELAGGGASVTLLERDEIAAGASGRNQGWFVLSRRPAVRADERAEPGALPRADRRIGGAGPVRPRAGRTSARHARRARRAPGRGARPRVGRYRRARGGAGRGRAARRGAGAGRRVRGRVAPRAGTADRPRRTDGRPRPARSVTGRRDPPARRRACAHHLGRARDGRRHRRGHHRCRHRDPRGRAVVGAARTATRRGPAGDRRARLDRGARGGARTPAPPAGRGGGGGAAEAGEVRRRLPDRGRVPRRAGPGRRRSPRSCTRPTTARSCAARPTIRRCAPNPTTRTRRAASSSERSGSCRRSPTPRSAASAGASGRCRPTGGRSSGGCARACWPPPATAPEGILLGGGTGVLAAALVTGGELPFDAAPFDPLRFAGVA